MLEGRLLGHFPIANLLDKMASTSRSGHNRILNCLTSSVALLSGPSTSLRGDLPSSSRVGNAGGRRSSMTLTMHTRLR